MRLKQVYLIPSIQNLIKSSEPNYNPTPYHIMSEQAEDRNSCSMVGLLGILIQVGLGALSFSVLIFKRYFQHPKRPWKIWAFDASKQMISQLIAHFINLTISLALTYDKKNSDECLWYFVTNVFDNTVGVFICIVLLKLTENSLQKRRKFQLISGNYYRKIDPLSLTHESNVPRQTKHRNPPLQLKQINSVNPRSLHKDQNNRKKSLIEEGDSKIQAFNADMSQSQKQKSSNPPEETQAQDNFIYIIDYKAWIIQLLIWNGIVIFAKCVLFGIQFGLEKQLQEFSMMILGWIEDYPILELLLVMVIVPVIMNGLAYWVQDNFLMKREKEAEEKNLIEENLKENARMNEGIHSQQLAEQKVKKPEESKINYSPSKQSDVESQGGRFEFHDDYDAKDDENAAQKFDNIFDKFNKFAT